MKSRFLNETLKEFCQEKGIDLEVFSDDWILKVQDSFIYGYHFDLNSDASSLIAQDKVATREILESAGVPVLDQRFFLRNDQDPAERIHEIQQAIRGLLYPLICKPNLGGGGKDVYKADTQEELIKAIRAIHVKERGVALSEFQNIDIEYRIIILDSKALLVYGKSCTDHSWKHNLSSGAKIILDIDTNTQKDLIKIAQCAMEEIGLRCGSVDIIDIKDVEGESLRRKVIEINSGVCLENFSKTSVRHKAVAGDVYKIIFDRLIERKRSCKNTRDH